MIYRMNARIVLADRLEDQTTVQKWRNKIHNWIEWPLDYKTFVVMNCK